MKYKLNDTIAKKMNLKLKKILISDIKYITECNDKSDIKVLISKLYYNCVDILDIDKKIYTKTNMLDKLKRIKDKKDKYDNIKSSSMLIEVITSIHMSNILTELELNNIKIEKLNEEIDYRNNDISIFNEYKKFLLIEIKLISQKISEIYLRNGKYCNTSIIIDSVFKHIKKNESIQIKIYDRIETRYIKSINS